jgi:L-ascorbate metabolism protein UlaG (beta-lactamase superfamily)
MSRRNGAPKKAPHTIYPLKKITKMKITYYGHSCFSVIAGDKHILFDPFISGNELAKDIDIETIQADYIFISHGHIDHMLDTEFIANRTGAMVVGLKIRGYNFIYRI